MPPTICQFLFCSIHDTMQVAGHHSDERLVPCLRVAHPKEFKQCSNVIFVSMGVLAAKAAYRI